MAQNQFSIKTAKGLSIESDPIDSKGALKGALIGAISAGIAQEIAGIGVQEFGALGEVGRDIVHGLAQGIISEASGGDFRSGFLGAALGHYAGRKAKLFTQGMSKGAGMAVRTAVAAVAGGTAAALGGGKFANGAVSAAFAHLFNNETDIWNRKALRGEVVKPQAVGTPYQRDVEGEWRTYTAGSTLDGTDLIPQKKIYTFAKMITFTTDQTRVVESMKFQDCQDYKHDTVYDLVNGNTVNEQAFPEGIPVGKVYSMPTYQDYSRRVETRTCWLGDILGC